MLSVLQTALHWHLFRLLDGCCTFSSLQWLLREHKSWQHAGNSQQPHCKTKSRKCLHHLWNLSCVATSEHWPGTSTALSMSTTGLSARYVLVVFFRRRLPKSTLLQNLPTYLLASAAGGALRAAARCARRCVAAGATSGHNRRRFWCCSRGHSRVYRAACWRCASGLAISCWRHSKVVVGTHPCVAHGAYKSHQGINDTRQVTSSFHV